MRAMGRYSIPSALMTVGVTALYNTDVILVRHYLSSYEAGLYAALSVLGKIIFFGTAPVTTTMFPLVSEAHAKGERYHRIFLLSLVFLLAIAGAATIIFTLVPALVMRIMIGAQYLDAAPYLTPFSIFLSLCSVIFLLANFFLSIHRTRAVYVVIAGAIVQAVAIVAYHANISTIITISLTVATIITVILSLYYIYVARS
jgi:O-antigen/teichoic acid export membrane protein